MGSVLIFDCETSSKAEDREIVEAAWLKMRPDVGLLGVNEDYILPTLQVEEAFAQRYRPERGITNGSIAVHGILPSDVANCDPSWSFHLPEDAAYIVGHSIDFDWQSCGAPAHAKRICTFAMSEHLWPDADSHSQVGMTYQLFGQTEETRALVMGAHRALDDCFLNRLLLKKILEQKVDIRTWSALWAYSEECRIPVFCPLKRWEGVKLEEMDEGSIDWCLRQPWLDPYFRKGLERVMQKRYGDLETAIA